MKIAVASTSVHKLQAVERACVDVFGPGIESEANHEAPL
jgi:non-canonical (house-cleaning) NTP pyrophosphatase